MPLTGPDLVGAGYPISRPLLALLGGTGNVSQANVPIKTNLDFGLGGLIDAVPPGGGSTVNVCAVPVLPGDVITNISVLVGATASSVTSGYGVLFTGTGSAPGTTGVSPLLIGQSASTAATCLASTRYSFTFAAPVTVSAAQCPFGFIYAGWELIYNGASPSFLAMTCASAAAYQWYPTSPVALYGNAASTTGNATLGTVTKNANPPIVLLS